MDSNYNLIGIGSGPFNLSLNALMNKTGLKTVFFDRRNDSRWHPNFLLDNCDLQVSWVKDLVSTIDPTSKYSFLNFLVETKEIFNFLSVRFDHVPRKTFSEYYNWASKKLGNIKYNEDIELVDYDDKGLNVTNKNGQKYYADNVSIGVGGDKYIPNIFIPHYGKNVFHSLDYLRYKESFSEENIVLVVGQGQSSLEVILDLLSNKLSQPAKIIWIGRKEHLSSMDDNPFVDNLYTPWFTENFYNSNEVDKLSYIEKLKYTSDGVSPKSAAELAQLIIKEKLSSKIFMCNTVEVEKISKESSVFKISSHGKCFDVDKIILCTGTEQKFPYRLLSEKLKDEIVIENNRPKVSSTGKLILKNKLLNVYVNGLLVNDFGLTEKNLATCAWRNAKIVNEIAGCKFYNTNFEKLVQVFEEI